MKERLERYTEYLKSLNELIEQCFEQQKDYIYCKPGCGVCCNNSDYPTSELEYEYLKTGLNLLNPEKKQLVRERVRELYKKRTLLFEKEGKPHKFVYICPLVDEGKCLIYPYRPMVCRTYGLIILKRDKGRVISQLPECANNGLNYSIIWDKNLKKLIPEKVAEMKALGKPPMPFTLHYNELLEDLAEIGHGDVKPLFEWIYYNESFMQD